MQRTLGFAMREEVSPQRRRGRGVGWARELAEVGARNGDVAVDRRRSFVCGLRMTAIGGAASE